ncbi:ubiquitin carboxyl-terminal hydrolase 22/27/51 [Pancytospora philotis]|nr:ubiquitin carboxyl-terminal hydrolase 22/27/51 [Pancytospora philotis]
MKECAHVIIVRDIQKYVRAAKIKLAENAKRGVALCCASCRCEMNLYVIFNCGTVVCGDHLHRQCRKFETHTAFYNISADSVYCAMCSECLVATRTPAHSQSAKGSAKFVLGDCIPLKILDRSGAAYHISSIMQLVLNSPRIRSYYFQFHHDLACCEAPACPACFIKKIYSQIYSLEPVNFTAAIEYVEQRAPHYSSYRASSVKEVYNLVTNIYHPQSLAAAPCQCVMHHVFFGARTVTAECSICCWQSSRREDFNMIEAESSKKLSVAAALALLAGEMPGLADCQRCRAVASVRTRFDISRLPLVLCISIMTMPRKRRMAADAGSSDVEQRIVVQDTHYSIYGFIEKRKGTSSLFVCYIHLDCEWYEFTKEKIIRGVDVRGRMSNALLFLYELDDIS